MANFPKQAPSIGRSIGLAGPTGATGAGIPAGGTINQALLVNSGGTVAWADQPVLNAEAWGVKSDGVTDDTAAWQAIAAQVKISPAAVVMPAGTSLISALVSWDQSFGFSINGVKTGGQINTMASRIRFTGTGSGNMFTFNSSTNWEVNDIGFEYTSTSYTGDLINVDGGPHAADSQNWGFNNCAWRSSTGAAITARSGVRLNKAINGRFRNCQFAGHGWALALGDPGGSYVVNLTVDKCGFNTPGSGRHVFVGTGDGESIVFRDCSFEGSYTSYYGVATSRDGAQNRLYAFREENCWHGDNTTADYVDGLFGQEGCSIISGRFASTSGTHLRLDGNVWSVEDSSFENGTVYDTLAGFVLNATGNSYVNNGLLFNASNFGAPGYPAAFSSFGNTAGAGFSFGHISAQVAPKFGILGPSADFAASPNDGDLILGARVNSGYQPAVLPPPSFNLVQAQATGGTFPAATYYWKVTALNAAGETLASAEQSQAIVLNGSAKLFWFLVPGATSYKVYRATSAGAENVSPALVATVSPPYTFASNEITYIDTGTATSAGAVPASSTAANAIAVISKGKTPNPSNASGLLLQGPWDGTRSRIALGASTGGTAPTTVLEVGEGPALATFGGTPVVQQTGGAAAASGTYTATEQGMINRMYAALRAYGLLT